ncbi:MAG: sigma-54-dependent Fis family transcriptional regulator [Thermodesulfobacteriota bacterium]|nr:MAG: sigma-54-dependent Fis family transcriptional regulator [Thermodesulfobacteriota bacterium]RLG13189.1 MAG: sigma-54-dependent Fis family transcriptional regulator [Candidatus Pacearchaeota archaeon]
MEKYKILIVEDERITLRNLEYILKKEGYEVTSTTSGVNALKLLQEEKFDLVLTDLKLEKVDGIEILEKCKEVEPDTEVIIITAYATISSAIESMKKGAFYYLPKPFKLEELKKLVKEALEKVKLKKEITRLKSLIETGEKPIIITQNPKMQKILETAKKIAPTDCNVVITGESGTGKELLAQYIHSHSLRANGPFVAINCSVLSEELLANELFGHEKGAFTGANTTKKGLIEVANKGTLFLDEISEMSLSMQAKLLRVIQEKEFIRLGGTTPIKVDVRFIAATNKDLKELLKEGKFREDLFYRLNVISFHLPPLSERKEDIPLLAYYFLKKYSNLMKKEVKEISPSALEILMNYDYPGNIRELENIIERGVALVTGDTLEPGHLPEDLQLLKIKAFRKKEGRYPTLEEQEKEYILWILKEVGGNKTLAAQILGIDRVSLWRKLKKYGIE